MSAEATLYCPRCLSTFAGAPATCPNLGCRSARPAEGWGELLGPGASFDRYYRVRRQLAVGGGGITYLARELDATDTETGPLLAIKVLYAGREHGSTLQRLSTEAQILRELNHPHIVECRGFVHRAGHTPYLITRFASGGNLLDHVRRVGPLPPRVVAAVGRQICRALLLAHARGVVHRDLKPENLLLEEAVPAETAPHVRVADFGIAKVQSALGAHTRSGAFVGTPAYAAPEQLLGAPPSAAADVYSLGAVLYFCATGGLVAAPEEGADWEERHAALVAALPPRVPPGRDPEASEALNRVLAKVMAVEPAERLDLLRLESELLALEQLAAPGEAGAAVSLGASTWTDISAPQARPAEPPKPAAHVSWLPPTHPSRSGGSASPSASAGAGAKVDRGVQKRALVKPAPAPAEPAPPAPRSRTLWVVAGMALLGLVGFVVALGVGLWLWRPGS